MSEKMESEKQPRGMERAKVHLDHLCMHLGEATQ